MAGAEALGKMGENGAGSIDLGSDGGNSGGMGFNPAAMMASMAVGGVVGQNIAGAMETAMSGINHPLQNSMTPPPVPNRFIPYRSKRSSSRAFRYCYINSDG